MTEEQLAVLRERLKGTGSARVKVGGWSMWPFLRDGDVLCLEKQDPPYPRGSVVGVLAGNQFIAHRIVGSNGGRYQIRGDYAPRSSGWVERREILGVVKARERRGGISRFWLTPPGTQLALFLSFFLVRLRGLIGTTIALENRLRGRREGKLP